MLGVGWGLLVTGVEGDDAPVGGVCADGYVLDGLVSRVVVGAHAGLGVVDHDLVELAAGRAGVVVLHRLREVDDVELLRQLQAGDFEAREDEVDAERGGAGHAAARDVADDHGVVARGLGQAVLRHHVVRAEGELRPGKLGHLGRLRRGDVAAADLEADDAVVGEVDAEEVDRVRPVRLVCGGARARSAAGGNWGAARSWACFLEGGGEGVGGGGAAAHRRAR